MEESYKIIDSEKLAAFLAAKNLKNICTLCGEPALSIGQEFALTIPLMERTRITLGGAPMVLIPVTCGNCGNTLLINAVMNDLLFADEEVGNSGK